MRNNYAGKPVTEWELKRDISQSPIKYNLFLKTSLSDITPVSAGETMPDGDQIHQIHTVDCANLYYILDGSGTLFLNDEVYRIKKGDYFVIPLGAKAAVGADPGLQLPHRWIGFTGTLMHEFFRFPIPFTLPDEVTKQLCDPEHTAKNLGHRLASDLLLIYSYLSEPINIAPDYAQRVVNRVNTGYMQKISVTEMANEFGLDRCHLSRIFKQKMNMSIQEYILLYRLSQAKRYLKHGYSISDTAQLCGFGDRTSFSKVFTREIGCTPSEWKKIIDWQGWNKPR